MEFASIGAINSSVIIGRIVEKRKYVASFLPSISRICIADV